MRHKHWQQQGLQPRDVQMASRVGRIEERLRQKEALRLFGSKNERGYFFFGVASYEHTRAVRWTARAYGTSMKSMY